MALDPIFSDAVIFASLLTLLSIGLTLTYITTRVPNFAHASLATIGMYVALVATHIWGTAPYAAIPVAFCISGLVALALYVMILRPLIRRGATQAIQMIATLAFDIVLIAALNIAADYIVRATQVSAREFTLRSYDLEVAGLPMVLVAAPAAIAILAVSLHLVLSRTRFGIAMRASTENADLAESVGINVKRVYAVSWLLGGGFAGVAGSLIALWFEGDPNFGPVLIPSVFAASIVGGFMSIHGAIAGGILVGLAEVLGTRFLAGEIGPWLIAYRPLIPLALIVATLFLAPRGLAGIRWRRNGGGR
ncbi:MAG: branched-chain amino acid ABC transporter permease [Nitrosopumilus sp.]|nr:branched-chain amino acid ABC transporter permease [Nitrosopumilus sp.]CAI9831012.1 putative branched-chain amino acid transport permease protein LivH [Nitrosopumilaceae archaeon]MDA7941699.1 branched-chain amino acid ABC transporter permease [Nitrosopumilus sp.]MDA7944006.1 branched-chain amino acid ABC transporter permease [Nitrosopumilus sp.]MDA7944965.1 branched-chain amino acid ABC transporter permease [Nitrosopumilus sp.]